MRVEMNLMLYTITPWVVSNKMTHREYYTWAVEHVEFLMKEGMSTL